MLIYKNNPTLPQGGPDIGLKVGILAEIGNMLHECAVCSELKQSKDGLLWVWITISVVIFVMILATVMAVIVY